MTESMSEAPKIRIKVPETAKAGEVIALKCLISHRMESGLMRGTDGQFIPRQIINRFSCTFDGELVFAADIKPGVSANPFFEFHARVNESGVFKFDWIDDDGTVYSDERAIDVS